MLLFEILQDTPPAGSAPEVADTIRDLFAADSWALKESFLIENWQWLGLLALVAIGVVFERFTAAFLRYLARRAGSSEKVKVDAKRLTRFVRPFGVMITWWVFVSLLPVLDIGQGGVARALDFLGSLVLTVAGMLAAWRSVDLVCDFLRARAEQTQNKFDDMLVPLLRRTLKIFVFLVGFAFVASKVTDDIWKIVAGASIGGAILALAFKDSVENVFGTFTVLLDKPFELGDWITVGEVDGTVERVGFRSTRVRTFYNSIITVPNRHFVSAKVDNWGARRYRRIKATLGLTYATPPEKVEAFCEGVREVIRQHPYTRKDYYHVYLNGFGASTLDIMLYCFVEVPDWSMELREKHRLFADILRVAETLGVQFAFPTQTLHMIQGEAELHPDRPGDDLTGAKLGREVGAQVAQHTLKPYGKSKPGKVKFIQNSSPLSAPGGEGGG
jgi:MscS family membrane protein